MLANFSRPGRSLVGHGVGSRPFSESSQSRSVGTNVVTERGVEAQVAQSDQGEGRQGEHQSDEASTPPATPGLAGPGQPDDRG